MIYLLITAEFFHSLGIIICGFFMAFVKVSPITRFKIPHPFAKYDYEWINAFRKTFFLPVVFVFPYVMGLVVRNYTLSLVCITVFAFSMILPFERPVEKLVMIWVNNRTPKNFIKQKISRIFIYFITPLNGYVFLMFLFPERILITMGMLLLALFSIVGCLIIKYAHVLDTFSISINQAIYLMSTIFAIIQPYAIVISLFLLSRHSSRAFQNLNSILDDKH